MRRALVATLGLPLLLAAATRPPIASDSSCLYLIPLYGTENQTVAPFSTGNQIDYYFRNDSPATLQVSVSYSSAGNILNLSAPPTSVTLIPGQSLDPVAFFDAGAARLKGNKITVTVSASCGSLQQDFSIAII
jgi:hypothetical protein